MTEAEAMPEPGGQERAGRSVARATLAIAAMHLLRFVVGFGEQVLFARYFGTSKEADAYKVAYKIPSTVFYGCEKILNPTLIPAFVDMREKEGEDAALRLAATAMLLQAGLLAVLVWLGCTFAKWLVLQVAPGYGAIPGKVDLTATLMVWIFPAVLFLGISSATYCVLNAMKRFASPALGDALWKVGTVAGLVLLYKDYGIWCIVIGFVAGSVMKLGTHLVALGRVVWRMRPSLAVVRHPVFKRMCLLMLPMAFGFAYSEARSLMDIRFASELTEGAYAALDYARKITDIPFQLVSYALGIALFPFLAERASARRWDELRDLLIGSLRMLLFLFVPLAAGLFVLAQPTLRIVYQGGEFTEESLALTIPALEFYALGMVALALEFPLLQAFYSLKNTLVPTLIGFGTSALQVLLAWYFVSHLSAEDPRGLALAHTVARTTKVILAFGILSAALSGGLPLRGQWGFIGRVLLATAITAPLLHLTYRAMLVQVPLTGRLSGLIVFLVCSSVGAVVYVIAAALLRVPEVRRLADGVTRRLRRRKAR